MKENLELATVVIRNLISRGVDNFIFCSGSFNSPFVAVCQHIEGIKLYNHFEERSAAFFALGLCKQIKQPVVICVTSGTAVAECLPAMIEAKYELLPLIVLSCDREKTLSGTGYPQAICQDKLLSSHSSLCLDIEDESDIQLPSNIDNNIHLNIRFKEPILESDFKIGSISISDRSKNSEDIKIHKKSNQLLTFLNSYQRPLVIIGKLESSLCNKVERFLLNLAAPVILEPLSGLRENKNLKHLIIKTNKLLSSAPNFDCILRIGGMPISDLWRTLERDSRYQNIPVCSLTKNAELPGLSRKSLCLDLDTEEFCDYPEIKDRFWRDTLIEKDREFHIESKQLLSRYPLSEASFINWISKQIPNESLLFLGNSLPIREWNQFADDIDRNLTIDANRGANGIDGQIASFLGAVVGANRIENWAIIGDLTFLYDCNSLCILPNLPPINFKIVVINNNGGRIFEGLPYYKKITSTSLSANTFINEHSFKCANIARSFGIEASSLSECDLPIFTSKHSLLEIMPSLEQTHKFQEELEQIYKKIK